MRARDAELLKKLFGKQKKLKGNEGSLYSLVLGNKKTVCKCIRTGYVMKRMKKNQPVPTPIVKYSVTTFFAKMLKTKQKKPKMAPAMVTGLHPYLFTKELEIGPEK